MDTITEGQEYRIMMDARCIYEGIAESDTEASERLESIMMWASATNESSKPITFKIEAL